VLYGVGAGADAGGAKYNLSAKQAYESALSSASAAESPGPHGQHSVTLGSWDESDVGLGPMFALALGMRSLHGAWSPARPCPAILGTGQVGYADPICSEPGAIQYFPSAHTATG
jgi:hypothetical protein